LIVLALLAGLLWLPAGARETPKSGKIISGPAAEEISPLDLIPAEADFFIEIKNPRRVAETIQDLAALEQLRQFPAIGEQLDSTNVRRFFQLVAYFEKQLGGKWPSLLDKLAGGGAALAGKFGERQPAVLVIQGKDEKLAEKFLPLLVEVIDGELARQEAKDRPVKETIRDAEVIRIGEEFFLTRQGAALIITNRKPALNRVLDLAAGRSEKSLSDLPTVGEARRMLPEKPLVNFWINMAPILASPQAREFYTTPRDNGALTVLFGRYLEVLGRSAFVTGAIAETKSGFLTTIRIPKGREGAAEELALSVPPPGTPGSRPLLEPRNALYSDSFYIDVSRIWTDREKLFRPNQAKALAEFDANSGRFLAGTRMSELLTSAGPYQRIVVVHQDKVGYKKEPRQKIPAFAFVTEMRDPEKFGKGMSSVLRAAALLASTQFEMKMNEEMHREVKIVGYRFDENKALKQDVNDIRFNFSPCFARTDNHFIFCSTMELCRELVELLQAERKSPGKSEPEQYRARVYASGVAGLLKNGRDQLITQTILDQAVPAREAREQVEALIDFVRGLGSLSIGAGVADKQTHYEIQTRR
jgi:hypothetical protein